MNDLDAIKERWERFRGQVLEVGMATELQIIWESDIPALFAEIKRLNDRVVERDITCPFCKGTLTVCTNKIVVNGGIS